VDGTGERRAVQRRAFGVERTGTVTGAAASSASIAEPGTARPSGPLQQRVAPDGHTDRRGAVRRRVDPSRVVAAGPQPGDHHRVDRGREDGAARRPPRRALDNGLQPSEASGLLAHLAIYSGWPNAVAALEAYDQVYTARKVDTAALRAVGPRFSAPASDAARAEAITEHLGAVAPKFAQLTNEVVFGDVWHRSDLSLRESKPGHHRRTRRDG